MVISKELSLRSEGYTEIQDITGEVERLLADTGVRSGQVTVFCPGSTCGVTTIEFESGAVEDLREVFEEIAPLDRDYRHHRRWGDDNGSAHVRAALLGPSLTVPIVAGRLTLGTWQQIVFIDFDTRPRSRRLIVHVMGE